MLSSHLLNQLQELTKSANLSEDTAAKILFLMEEAYQEGYDTGCDHGPGY
jgi:hypothetical protein